MDKSLVFRLNSKRYRCFDVHGFDCCQCGMEGKFFAKEIHKSSKSYMMNLYGFDSDGDEVLMTVDHILPQSKGGKDNIENLQKEIC